MRRTEEADAWAKLTTSFRFPFFPDFVFFVPQNSVWERLSAPFCGSGENKVSPLCVLQTEFWNEEVGEKRTGEVLLADSGRPGAQASLSGCPISHDCI